MNSQEIKTVLVASDFSEAATNATQLAFSIVAQGGTVVLLHIVKSFELVNPIHAPSGITATALQARHGIGVVECRERMQNCIPTTAEARNISVEIEVIENTKAAPAILDMASRYEADLICLGRHGHSRLATALLGSTSEYVINHSTIPVLLSP